MYSQDTIHYEKVDDFRRVYFEIGIQNPQKDLSNKFEKSYNIGIWLRNKIKKNQFLDLGIELNFLNKPRAIEYNDDNSIVKFDSSKDGLKAGLRYSRIFSFNKNNTNFNVESNSGIGWAALYYNVPEYYGDQIRDKLNKKTNLNTIFLSQTIKLNVYDFGIFCSYYYTPYTMFKKSHESNFGSQSLAFGIVYRM
ncbi:hypothetical protein OX283_000185 [Flavobacterium sp. SUN052]|nr:hypothetical protein [Flavobacterium sp. SUN052]